LHAFRLKKMAGGFASASPASAKRSDTTVIDVHTAAANIKQTLGADVNVEHFIDVKMLPANPMHLMFWMACLRQSQY
jgi:hypothetical protein